MKLYLDDDVASNLLHRLLSLAGHDVLVPAEIGLSGDDDAVHFLQAIRDDRRLLTGNHDGFEHLHDLVLESGGHHPGIQVVCRENDPRRDLSPRGIVLAVRKLSAAGLALQDGFHILNYWR
ncbi:MAG: DUF5615 family PIN-like protein [Candidatus Anammoximicrobium sp.]|nr:DUF5615 family PIN-like protein [Candidatus Anammoximicrobium sp.]